MVQEEFAEARNKSVSFLEIVLMTLCLFVVLPFAVVSICCLANYPPYPRRIGSLVPRGYRVMILIDFIDKVSAH